MPRKKQARLKKNRLLDPGEILNPNIAVETEGNVKVVYTNKESTFIHDMNGFKVSVDEYQIVKVNDMNEDSTIPFDDQIDGYVVSTKVTIENGTSKPMYYNNRHKIQLSNANSRPKFYQDRLTTDNMDGKKMIFRKSGTNETRQIDDVKVTLEGV